MTNRESFELKGSRFTITALRLNTLDAELLKQEIDEKVSAAPSFFKNLPIVLDVQGRKLESEIQLADLAETILSTGLMPVGVQGLLSSQLTFGPKVGLPLIKGTSIHDMGTEEAPTSELETEPEPTQSETTEQPEEPQQIVEASYSAETKIVRNPVRSGQQVYSSGDLVVLNSVSPGAELLAEGNIHVYGALNGRALAGVKGKTDALICCSALGSELVSIAGTYVLQDDIKKRYFGQAVSIELNEDNLSFKLLN